MLTNKHKETNTFNYFFSTKSKSLTWDPNAQGACALFPPTSPPPTVHSSTTLCTHPCATQVFYHQPQPAFLAHSPMPQAPNPLATRLRASHSHPVPPPWNPSCRHQDLLEVCRENVIREETQSSQKPQATGRRVPVKEPSTTSIRLSQQFICSTAKYMIGGEGSRVMGHG